MSNHAILLHGWGVNHQVFADFLPLLQPFNAQAIDLMGYDGNHHEFILSQAVDIAAEKWQGKVHLFGWSLGGVVALEIAQRQPEKVATLTLCCSFARFAQADDYAIGMPTHNWQGYPQRFSTDYSGSLKQFFALNALANTQKMPQFNRLADKIIAFRQPEKQVLYSSQQAVVETDLRNYLTQIQIPTLIITGKRDRVTPPAMGEYLHQNIAESKWQNFSNSAHMPFVSEDLACAEKLVEFWRKYSFGFA